MQSSLSQNNVNCDWVRVYESLVQLTGLNNVCAMRDFMGRADANGLGTIPNLEKMAAFLKSFVWRPVYGEKVGLDWKWWKYVLTQASSTIGQHIHMGLKLVQLVKIAREPERFIEDLGDDIRLTPGFGFYLRPSYCFFRAHAKPSEWAC